MPLGFSIVVPTLNRKEMLRDAIASIRSQNWRDTEIIVVDGGSLDGTVEEVGQDRNIRLLTGPDRGVYDALNKGIAQATRDVVGLLNSDDLYEPGAFAAAARAFATSDVTAVCGTAVLVEGDNVIAVFDREGDKTLATPRPIFIGSCIPNARFYRRSALPQLGPYSLDYQYVADRDWLARCYEAGLKTASIPEQVYRYRQHPGSLTFGGNPKRQLQIRAELWRLARRWRLELPASFETKNMALVLEGRCLATLLAAALRTGSVSECRRLLAQYDSKDPIGPLQIVFRGFIDWLRVTFGRG